MIISAVSITPERQEKYNLTAPYVSNYQCIVTAADKQDVKSPADFSGNRVAVQQATTSDDLITEQALTDPTIQIFRYEKVTQCFDELRLGRADAVYVDSVVAAYYTKDDPDYVRTWISDGREPMGVCIRKDNLKLLESVEAAINTLVFTGKLGEIAIRHFGDDFTTGLRDVIALPVIPPLDT
jgi:ABC-type amino acid transport substrate-binding protein